MSLTGQELVKLIDHTLLSPTATKEDIGNLCREAREYEFWSVCVNPVHVATARDFLMGTGIKVCTVVGFPLGANSILIKEQEAYGAIANGAEEVDMVMALGKGKEGDWQYVEQEIRAVKKIIGEDKILKVIVETGLLEETEIVKACLAAQHGGADLVKTSTGFLGEGASREAVALMHATVGETMGIKASGGIRSLAKLKEMVDQGANRIGTSSGVAIAQEFNRYLKE